MSLHKLIVTAIAVLLVVFLYNLPKVVVDNDSAQTGLSRSAATSVTSHDFAKPSKAFVGLPSAS